MVSQESRLRYHNVPQVVVSRLWGVKSTSHKLHGAHRMRASEPFRDRSAIDFRLLSLIRQMTLHHDAVPTSRIQEDTLYGSEAGEACGARNLHPHARPWVIPELLP